MANFVTNMIKPTSDVELYTILVTVEKILRWKQTVLNVKYEWVKQHRYRIIPNGWHM